MFFIFAVWGSAVVSTFLVSLSARVQSLSRPSEQEGPSCSVCRTLFLTQDTFPYLRVYRHYPVFPSLNVLPFTLIVESNSEVYRGVLCWRQGACEEQGPSTHLHWTCNECVKLLSVGACVFHSMASSILTERGSHFTFCHTAGDLSASGARCHAGCTCPWCCLIHAWLWAALCPANYLAQCEPLLAGRETAP